MHIDDRFWKKVNESERIEIEHSEGHCDVRRIKSQMFVVIPSF